MRSVRVSWRLLPLGARRDNNVTELRPTHFDEPLLQFQTKFRGHI